MPSLQHKHKVLSHKVPDVKVEDMLHVIGGIYCPVSVLYGHPSVHSSNGVYAARDIAKVGSGEECDVVYASCPNCVMDKSLVSTRGGKDVQLVEMVQGTEDSQHPWVVYTRANYDRIAEAAAKSRTHPAKIPKTASKSKTG
jgi:hypothetical protein